MGIYKVLGQKTLTLIVLLIQKHIVDQHNLKEKFITVKTLILISLELMGVEIKAINKNRLKKTNKIDIEEIGVVT